MFMITTAVPGCALQTDDSTVAHSFIRMIDGIMSPGEFLSVVMAHLPTAHEATMNLINTCLGVAS